MTNDIKPPGKIYLQYDPHGNTSTWCSDRIDENDWSYKLEPLQICLMCWPYDDPDCEWCDGTGVVTIEKRLEQEKLL